MGWMEFILAIATLVLGTGWLFTYRAYKRKANGEAAQSEAEGWKAMQDVYQQTIADLKAYAEDVRKDRNHLLEDRDKYREENEEMREKINKLDEEISDLKKDLARQGRKIEALTPFLCGVVGCMNRSKVDLHETEPKEEQ